MQHQLPIAFSCGLGQGIVCVFMVVNKYWLLHNKVVDNRWSVSDLQSFTRTVEIEL